MLDSKMMTLLEFTTPNLDSDITTSLSVTAGGTKEKSNFSNHLKKTLSSILVRYLQLYTQPFEMPSVVHVPLGSDIYG
jgi:hypothetical protein